MAVGCKYTSLKALKELEAKRLEQLDESFKALKLPAQFKEFFKQNTQAVFGSLRRKIQSMPDRLIREGHADKILSEDAAIALHRLNKSLFEQRDIADLIKREGKKIDTEAGLLGLLKFQFVRADDSMQTAALRHQDTYMHAIMNSGAGKGYGKAERLAATKLFAKALEGDTEIQRTLAKKIQARDGITNGEAMDRANYEIAEALENGHYSDFVELDIIADSFKQAKKQFAAELDSNPASILDSSQLAITRRTDKGKIMDLGREGFIKMLKKKGYDKHISKVREYGLEGKDLDDFLGMFYDELLAFGNRYKNKGVKSRIDLFEFSDTKAKLGFLDEVSEPSENPIAEAFNQTKRLKNSRAIEDVMGPDHEDLIKVIGSSIRKAGVDNKIKFDLNRVNGVLDEMAEPLVIKTTGTSYDNIIAGASDIASDAVSGILLPQSTLREAFFDLPLMTAAVNKAVFGRPFVSNYLKSIINTLDPTYLRNPAYRDALVEELRKAGVDTMAGMHSMFLAEYDKAGMSAAQGNLPVWVKKGRRLSKEMARFTARLSAGDFTRNRGRIETGRVFSRNLVDWIHGSKSVDVDLSALAKHDIGKAELDLLRRIPVKDIGNGMAKFIDFDNHGLKKSDLEGFMRPGETANDSVLRLKSRYEGFFVRQVNEAVTLPSARERINMPNSPLAKAAIKQVSRFMAMAETQWHNSMRMIRYLQGKDTYDESFGSFAKNPKAIATMLVAMATGGYIVQWLKDLAKFQTPREINVENTAKSILIAGGGGILGGMLLALLDGEDPVTLPAASLLGGMTRQATGVVKGIQEEDAKKWQKNAIGLARTATIATKFPYTIGLTNFAVREFLQEGGSFTMADMAENNQQYFLAPVGSITEGVNAQIEAKRAVLESQ